MTSEVAPEDEALAELGADRPLPQPGADAPEALAALVAWVRPRDLDDSAQASARLLALAGVLRARADLRGRWQETIQAWIESARTVPLLSEVGILSTRGFVAEIVDRLYERVLPAPAVPGDLRDAMGHVFLHGDDRWLAGVAPESWAAFFDALGLDASPRTRLYVALRAGILGAAEVLALRVAAEGTESELLHIDPDAERHDSPFLALQREVVAYLAALDARFVDPTATVEPPAHVRVLLAQCLEGVGRLRSIGRKRGTTVRVTYLLERMEQQLRRLEALVDVIEPPKDSSRSAKLVSLFRELALATARRLSVAEVWSCTMRLLAKRVTENASRTGEHYVARDRDEYFGMMRAAMGAGVVISLMALLKVGITSAHLPPLVNAALICADYALGFVIIHILHFTVATKQPAMTAATIAASIEESSGRRVPLDGLVRLIACVMRTQLVAIFGNVVVALPMAMAIASGFAWLDGRSLVGTEKAASMLLEIRPIMGYALVGAAAAGVWLFVAGLVTGWYDNRCAVLDVPGRIRGSPMLRWMSPAARERIAGYMGENLGAIMGNVVFGLLLGATGFAGVLLGLPIDIRHVAFASANLGYATVTLGLAAEAFLAGLAFVLMIGAVNLVVSFCLALRLALRSRDVTFNRARELGAETIALLRREPGAFFLPPR